MARGFFGALFDKAKGGRRGAHEVDRGVKDVGRRVVHHPRHPVAQPQDITLGRSSVPTGRGTNIGVPHDEGLIPAFLAGTNLNVTSSIIRAAKYNRSARELTLFFLSHGPNGKRLHLRDTVYLDLSEREAGDFYRAPSKGRFWHKYLLGPGWRPGGGTIKSWRFA